MVLTGAAFFHKVSGKSLERTVFHDDLGQILALMRKTARLLVVENLSFSLVFQRKCSLEIVISICDQEHFYVLQEHFYVLCVAVQVYLALMYYVLEVKEDSY